MRVGFHGVFLVKTPRIVSEWEDEDKVVWKDDSKWKFFVKALYSFLESNCVIPFLIKVAFWANWVLFGLFGGGCIDIVYLESLF